MRNISLKLVVAFLFIGTMTSAQSAEKKTILINGEPSEVMVTSSGDIESTVRERPGYMKGYNRPPANLKREVATNPVVQQVASIPESASGDMKVTFGQDKFVLDNSGTESLGSVVDKLGSTQKGFVLLRSKFKASSSASNVIAQKRVYACKKYLESKGIAPNKILISLEPGDMDSNDVKIFLR